MNKSVGKLTLRAIPGTMLYMNLPSFLLETPKYDARNSKNGQQLLNQGPGLTCNENSGLVKVAGLLRECNPKTTFLLCVTVHASVLRHPEDGATEQRGGLPVELGYQLEGGFAHHACRHCEADV